MLEGKAVHECSTCPFIQSCFVSVSYAGVRSSSSIPDTWQCNWLETHIDVFGDNLLVDSRLGSRWFLVT